MARSTKKSLAGQAASAARKIIRPRKAAAAPAAPAKKAAAKKAAPAKKAAAKKAAPAPAKKAAAKKAAPAPAKKAAAKKAAPAPAKKTAAPAKKAAPAPAKKAAAKKSAPAPVKKAPAPAKKTTKKAPATVTKTPAKTPAKKAAPVPAKKAAPAPAPAKKAAAAPAKKTAAPAKKTAAKKTTPARLVVLDHEEAWSKAELAEVLRELHDQREESAQILAEQAADLSGLLRDSGDGAGQDQADLGATSFERDHELTVLNHEREKLAQIDRALARIDDGTYGVCESCGNPIGKMRLMAFPRATLCMTCKQREERR
ncbi:TraR/DksA C4-type zinc finger protein [Nocardioides sp. WV_118_6]